MLAAANRQEYEQGRNTDAGLESSRRVELQAQCFSGMFFAGTGAALGQDAVARASYDSTRRGDQPGNPRDHGQPENTSVWFEQGLQKNSTAQCNTWLVSPDLVS